MFCATVHIVYASSNSNVKIVQIATELLLVPARWMPLMFACILPSSARAEPVAAVKKYECCVSLNGDTVPLSVGKERRRRELGSRNEYLLVCFIA